MTRDDQDELVEAEVECAWSGRRGVLHVQLHADLLEVHVLTQSGTTRLSQGAIELNAEGIDALIEVLQRAAGLVSR